LIAAHAKTDAPLAQLKRNNKNKEKNVGFTPTFFSYKAFWLRDTE
jgi:hypothetical protein